MQLFESQQESPGKGTDGPVVAVAVNANVWPSYDYLWPEELSPPQRAQRVRLPFGRGNRKTLGFVVDPNRPPVRRELKAVAEVLDPAPQLDETLWQLGQWISQYYLTPLGMTLAAMVPSAVGRHAARTETVVTLNSLRRDWPDRLGGRQRRILDELLEAKRQGIEPLSLEQLLHHSGASRDSVQRLAGRSLICLDVRPVRLETLAETVQDDAFDLNEDQQRVWGRLSEKLSAGFSASLLYGVTGSGKTEVYLRLIRQVLAAGRQAIVLTPEIALATQTLQRFVKRLPNVAVLHSGLTDAQRAFHYQQIREGHAGVVIGPRSAIFAPTRKLGLIVVDEENEPSYKQDTAPRYHGRDVAVKRAQLEGVPIVLGSATPSLESYHNAQQGRYELLRLPHRVRGLPMPKLHVVSLRKELQRGRIELLGQTLTRKIAGALDRREQIILLMNRRGYASYVFCPSCDWQMGCQDCTRSMVFHQATQLAMCHYCSATAALPEICPACRRKIVLFGWGIQRIDNELARKFPHARTARMDSDTMTSPAQFQKVFDAFSSGELDILLGTQMVAKGLDFPRVSLVGVVSADTSLAIPDFRSAERTFQLIVQVAGRAGRADLPGEVIVQTLNENEPAIQRAVHHDFEGFAAGEIPLRAQTNLPPFSRLVRLILRHPKLEKAAEAAEQLAEQLTKTIPPHEATILGPQPTGVRKIRNLFRFQILLFCRQAGSLQRQLVRQMQTLTKVLPAELIADVDPIHLM